MIGYGIWYMAPLFRLSWSFRWRNPQADSGLYQGHVRLSGRCHCRRPFLERLARTKAEKQGAGPTVEDINPA